MLCVLVLMVLIDFSMCCFFKGSGLGFLWISISSESSKLIMKNISVSFSGCN